MIGTGDVIPAYPYLWRWQQGRGEETGRKDRPVCVALAMRGSDGLTHLALLPISGTPPRPDQQAIELPALEVRRIGLDSGKPAWIIVSEYNYDILERSFALAAPESALRRLSPGFLKIVLTAFRRTLLVPGARIDRR